MRAARDSENYSVLVSRLCHKGRPSRRNLEIECQFKISTTKHIIKKQHQIPMAVRHCGLCPTANHHLSNWMAVFSVSCNVVLHAPLELLQKQRPREK